MHYAHLKNNIVDFVLRVPPRSIFDASYADEFVEAPEGVDVGWLWDGDSLTPPPPPPFDRHATALQIDEAVAAIYGRFTRFQLEYTERETQAQAFKDAGYAGEVPPRVLEFSLPSGMSPKDSADLILLQAHNLRTAFNILSGLRMRKYEVLRAETDQQAKAAFEDIMNNINLVASQLS